MGERSLRKSYYPQLQQQLEELEKSRNELAESQARYRSLVENINDVIFRLNAEGEITYLSPVATRVTGHTPEECIGQPFAKFIHPDDLAFVRASFERTVADQLEPVEFRVLDKTGAVRYVRVSGRPMMEEGRVVGLTGVLTDITERKRAEETIRQLADYQSALLYNAPYMVISATKDGIITTINPMAARSLGYSAEECIGKLTPAVFHDPNEVAERAQVLTAELGVPVAPGFEVFIAKARCGLADENEWTYIRKDSSRFPVLLSVTALRDSYQNIIGFMGIASDITERKRTEAALEKRILSLTQPLETSEGIAFEELFNLEDIQHLQDMFAEACGVASIITHVDGTPITKPSNFCSLCIDIIRKTDKGLKNCYCSDAVIGRHNVGGPIVQPCLSGGLWDAGSSITVGGRHVANWLIGQVRNETQNEEEIVEYAREIGADEQAFRMAYRKVPVMSRERFEHVAQMLFAIANQLSTVAYQNILQARFIAEHRRAEDALRDSEKKYRCIVDTANEGIWVIGPDTLTTWVNGQMADLLGCAAVEMLGHPLTDFMFEEDVPDHQRKMEYRRQGVSEHYEHRFRRKDGQTVWTLASATPILDEQHRYQGSFGMFTDITERKRAEEEQAKLRQHLQQAQKMETVGQLAGGVAHDFNNILGIINGCSEILLGKTGLNEANRGYVEQILTAGQRAASLTRQLLAFSRKLVLQPQVFRLNVLIEGFGKMLRRLIGDEIEVRTILDPNLDSVNADPSQMEQVLLNFCINARDAMPEGGSITIETSNVDVDEAMAAQHFSIAPGRYVKLTVSDTGVGMDKETLSHVFEPFFTTKGPEHGTGLGLATVYGIVKQSGGHVWAYSEPGQGSIFSVYLPATTEQVQGREQEPMRREITRGSETILLVEDSASLRALLRELVEDRGYTVLEAEDGESAIQIAERYKGNIALLLTDVSLPKLKGPALAKVLQREKPGIRVLFMSGYAANEIASQDEAQPRTAFLQKPFSAEALAGKIRELLDRREENRGQFRIVA
jgi:PAS domain S-box-containing protein